MKRNNLLLVGAALSQGLASRVMLGMATTPHPIVVTEVPVRNRRDDDYQLSAHDIEAIEKAKAKRERKALRKSR